MVKQNHTSSSEANFTTINPSPMRAGCSSVISHKKDASFPDIETGKHYERQKEKGSRSYV
jgi:hypothetical protein